MKRMITKLYCRSEDATSIIAIIAKTGNNGLLPDWKAKKRKKNLPL